MKAIAFDLVGVLVRENDTILTKNQREIEMKFGHNDFNVGYSKDIDVIINKIYYKCLEYNRVIDILDSNNLRRTIASNHVSQMRKWLEKNNISKDFDDILLSAEVGVEKPSSQFFKLISDRLKERPKDILFIDDNIINVNSARKEGFVGLHYKRSLHGELDAFLKKKLFLHGSNLLINRI